MSMLWPAAIGKPPSASELLEDVLDCFSALSPCRALSLSLRSHFAGVNIDFLKRRNVIV